MNNGAAIAVSIVLSIGIYIFRSDVMKLFLNERTAALPGVHELAESLLLFNLIGQPFEAVRIVSGGVLRGWQDLLFPTLVNILLMTVVGVTAGWAIGYYRDNESPLPMFWVRLAAIALSAAINCYRFAMHMKSDTQLYAAGQAKLGVGSTAVKNTVSCGGWCNFLPACLKPRNIQPEVVDARLGT